MTQPPEPPTLEVTLTPSLTPTQALPHLQLLSPMAEADAELPYPLFRWTGHPRAVAYRLVVINAKNKVRFRQRFEANAVCVNQICSVDAQRLADFPQLAQGRAFRWRIVAILPKRTVPTAWQAFTIDGDYCAMAAVNPRLPQCTNTPTPRPLRTNTPTPRPPATATRVPPTNTRPPNTAAPTRTFTKTPTRTRTKTPTPRWTEACIIPTPCLPGSVCQYAMICTETPDPTLPPYTPIRSPTPQPSLTPTITPSPTETPVPCAMRDRNGVNVLAATANTEADGGGILANHDSSMAALMLMQINSFRALNNWVKLGSWGVSPEALPYNSAIPRLNEMAQLMVDGYCQLGDPLSRFSSDKFPEIASSGILRAIANNILARFEISIHATRATQFTNDGSYPVKYVISPPVGTSKAIVIGDANITNAWLRYQCELLNQSITSGPKFELMRGDPTNMATPFTKPDSQGAKYSCEPGEKQTICQRLSHYWVKVGNGFEKWTTSRMVSEGKTGYGAQCE